MGNKVKIIIVDDHEIFRSGLRMVIDNLDYTKVIGEAADGLEFLTLLETAQPDMVFIDVRMPLMNGIEATKVALKKYPNLSIIALSMYGEEECLQEMVEAGVKGFLLKNIKKAELDIAIRSVLEGRNYYSGELLKFFTRKYFGNKNINDVLSKRELEILILVVKGCANEEIAKKLFISRLTVDTHKTSILKKTDSENVAKLFAYSLKNGSVKLSDLGIPDNLISLVLLGFTNYYLRYSHILMQLILVFFIKYFIIFHLIFNMYPDYL